LGIAMTPKADPKTAPPNPNVCHYKKKPFIAAEILLRIPHRIGRRHQTQRRKGAKALPIRNRDSFFASLRLGDFALKNLLYPCNP
jgi:hypothetical protein